VSYILPYFSGAILGEVTQPAGLLILAIHPFSISMLVTDVVYPQLYEYAPLPQGVVLLVPRYVPSLLSFLMTFAYFTLAGLVAKRTLGSVSSIAHGVRSSAGRRAGSALTQTTSAAGQSRYLDLKVSKPLRAYVLKDLRLASRNPSMAFFFASPVFVVIILYIVNAQFPLIRAEAMFASTIIGCFFAIMFCSTLLNTEGAALEYTLTLPIRSRTILDAKVLMASAAYVPVPLVLLAVALSKHLTSNLVLLIPFIEVPAVVAACTAEIAFFLRPGVSKPIAHVGRGEDAAIVVAEKEKMSPVAGGEASSRERLDSPRGFSIMAGSDIKRLMQALAVAWSILLVPVAGYALSFSLTLSHPISIEAMASLALCELLAVFMVSKRSRQGSISPA
jgi:hypothetical protein